MLTRKQAEDIRWVAAEVSYLAVILQSHGLRYLASKLNAVEQALQHAPGSGPAAPERGHASGEIISLESYRKRSVKASIAPA